MQDEHGEVKHHDPLKLAGVHAEEEEHLGMGDHEGAVLQLAAHHRHPVAPAVLDVVLHVLRVQEAFRFHVDHVAEGGQPHLRWEWRVGGWVVGER